MNMENVLYLHLLLIICCSIAQCRGCLDDEGNALQQIRESLGYVHERFDSQSSIDDCCQWELIDCDLTSSHVTRIFFYNSREDALGYTEPWLPDMSLFAQFKELKELDLRGNHIGGLLNPEALCDLVQLQVLKLNSIEDVIQPCWGNLKSLTTLDLSYNLFTGTIAPVLANLSEIGLIDVSHNLFQGFVPLATFANHSNLRYLDLSYNPELAIESEYPTWNASFQVQHLFLAGCNLNNQTGRRIPSFLRTQYNLQTVDLSRNSLQGNFPAWMLRNVSSVLRLRGNSFVGQFPQDHQHKNFTLVELDISANELTGILPSNFNVSFPKLYRFSASSNHFSGEIPPSLGELGNLQHLDLSRNLFSGLVPGGLTRNSPLWYLNLSNNSLSGGLLPSDCNMRQLNWLLLHHNGFEGNLPTCLLSSQSLKLLDVRHNLLSGVIPNQRLAFMELGALLLGRNQFGGQISRQLCRIQRLQFLDLSHNLFSGTVPSCLRKNVLWRIKSRTNAWVPIDFSTKGNAFSYQGIPLTLMTGIDFSSNGLVGSIPEEISELVELHSLNLSHNQLTGCLPKSLGNLHSLESLDLSHNRLTGEIPIELTQITTLTTFNVAFNNLSGRIPFYQQLSTFQDSSFVGNADLCGEQVDRKCEASHRYADDEPRETEEKHASEAEGDQITDKPLFFYSLVFISYSLGFWGFMAPLCFNVNWRRKYFYVVDTWIDYFLDLF